MERPGVSHTEEIVMATIDLNAEIYEALSIIAKDESLLKKAVRSLKRLATQKVDETLMTEDASLPEGV